MQTFKTVDEYLKNVPQIQRKTLEKIRKAIKAAAPLSEEVISYGIPMYNLHGSLGGFGAFKNHCSYFPASSRVMKELATELKSYKTSKGTIQFPIDKPLPDALVKKMIRIKMEENEALISSKAETKKNADDLKIAAYMKSLKHPLKAEVEEVRKIIKNSHADIRERIKWNAPSYYTNTDLLSFNLRNSEQVHLVLHHPAIEKISSPLLQGDYKGRRMIYFKNMKEVRSYKKELQRIITELIARASK